MSALSLSPKAIPCFNPILGKLTEVKLKLPLPGVTLGPQAFARTLVLHPMYPTSVLKSFGSYRALLKLESINEKLGKSLLAETLQANLNKS